MSNPSGASVPARPGHVVPSGMMERLDGPANFHTWKFTMEHILILEGLWDAVTGKDTDPGNQQRALARIYLALKPCLYQYVRNTKTAKEAWNKLKDTFEDKGLFRRVLLLRKLHRIQLADFETMTSYIEEVTTLVQQLSDIGKSIEDAEVAEILLSGLSSEYDTVVSSISAVNASSVLSSEFVKA